MVSCSCLRRETRARGRHTFSNLLVIPWQVKGEGRNSAKQNLKAQGTKVEGKKRYDKGHH